MTATLVTSFDSANVFRRYVERNANYALSLLGETGAAGLSRHTLQTVLQALQFSQSLPELWPTSKQLLLDLAPRMELLDLRLIWRSYLEHGLAQSIEHDDECAEMWVRYYLGNLLRESSDFDGAVAHYRRALSIATAQRCQNEEIILLNRYAFTLRRQHDYGQAETLARRALELAQQPPENLSEQAYSYLVLGSIRFDQGALEECLVYSQKTLALWKAANETVELPWAYNNLGAVLLRMGDFEGARQHLQIAVSLLRGQGDIVYLAIAEMNLGLALAHQGYPGLALEHLAEAEKVFRRVQDRLRLGMVAHNMGFVYRQLGRWQEAIDAYEMAISIWDDLGNVNQLLNSMHSLAALYAQLHQPEEARAIVQRAEAILATIEDEEAQTEWRQAFEEMGEEIQ